MGIVSVFHLLDKVVPVDQDVPDGTHPLSHEGHVTKDFLLLFIGLSSERVGDTGKVLPHLREAAIRLDLLVRKMHLGTVAQGASTHIVAGGQAAFLGLPLDDVALSLSDTGVQMQGAPGFRFGYFLFHTDKLCWSAPMRAWEHSKKPLENGKRKRNRTTLAFLAMAVSRLDRGTFPANTAGASRNGLSGLFIDKRTAGSEAVLGR